MEQESSGFTVLDSHAGDSFCWLYSTLYNLEWPPIMARCSIIFAFFKRGLGHFASKSPKANIRLIKKARSLTVVLTLQLAKWRGFRRVVWERVGHTDRATDSYSSFWQVVLSQVSSRFLLCVVIIVN